MTESYSTYEAIMEAYNSPEAKKRREEEMKLADNIIHTATGCEVSDLKNDMIFSCLRTNENLYKDYANTIKEHPECKKYLQIYNYNGKDFLVVPLYDKSDNSLEINTVEIGKDDEILKIISDPYWLPVHPYTKESNVIPVHLEDKTQQYGYHRVSMNKWTGEISDVDPSEYSMDEKGINGLIDVIGEKAGKNFADCSEGMQSSVRDIISKEGEIKQNSHGFEEQKRALVQNIVQGNFSGAVNAFIGIVKSFFEMKKNGRIIGIGKGINYEGDEKDVNYLESAINTVLEPEQRSKLTYLLSKIKDKHTKEGLKEKGIENPSQFDLLMQQLQPGQIMLTNALDSEGQSGTFKFATQLVCGSRWCHALIISDVIKDSNGVVTDAKIIQSTLKGGVHETTLKQYVKENYSSSDFLLANIPEKKREDIINNAKSKIGQKYDRVSIVTDSIFGADFAKGLGNGDFIDNIKGNILGNNKEYCSELVFDAIEKAGLKMPEPHMSPSDLLMTDEITPQYVCYCENLG